MVKLLGRRVEKAVTTFNKTRTSLENNLNKIQKKIIKNKKSENLRLKTLNKEFYKSSSNIYNAGLNNTQTAYNNLLNKIEETKNMDMESYLRYFHSVCDFNEKFDPEKRMEGN